MQEGSYRFNVGAFQCLALSDGSMDYSPQRLFANVPPAVVEEARRGRNLPTDHVTTPYTFLYVDTGSSRVLVDMGAGHLAPTTGRWPVHLRAAGLDPAQIGVVVITHAHPDHVGGALDGDGNPIYANARLLHLETGVGLLVFRGSNREGSSDPCGHRPPQSGTTTKPHVLRCKHLPAYARR
jgi:glyoxylase-like metal-dependent hydrolase (beta-lactamase superfamily II)